MEVTVLANSQKMAVAETTSLIHPLMDQTVHANSQHLDAAEIW